MSGLLPLSKKSAERRCVSRWVLLVSMDAAATVTVPLTWPVGETVPFPLTWRKTPFTGIRPHMFLLCSRMLDLRGSRTHSPARAPSFSRACSAGAVICPDGACMIVSLSHQTDLRRHLYDTSRRRNVTDDRVRLAGGGLEKNRTRLRAVAYRMLGSLAEADDAVQEAWLRASRSDASGVDSL